MHQYKIAERDTSNPDNNREFTFESQSQSLLDVIGEALNIQQKDASFIKHFFQSNEDDTAGRLSDDVISISIYR